MSENLVINFHYPDKFDGLLTESKINESIRDYKGCSKEFRKFSSSLREKLEKDIELMKRELMSMEERN